MFSCLKCAELFWRSLNGLSFCANFFNQSTVRLWSTHVVCLGVLQVISLIKVMKKLHHLDFPLIKILRRNGLQLYLEKNGRSVKITKCVQSISFQMTF